MMDNYFNWQTISDKVQQVREIKIMQLIAILLKNAINNWIIKKNVEYSYIT